MTLDEFDKEILESELAAIRRLLDMAADKAFDKYTASTPICDYLDGDCSECPIDYNDDYSLCGRLQNAATIHEAAREYIQRLEAAIKKKGGATDA